MWHSRRRTVAAMPLHPIDIISHLLVVPVPTVPSSLHMLFLQVDTGQGMPWLPSNSTACCSPGNFRLARRLADVPARAGLWQIAFSFEISIRLQGIAEFAEGIALREPHGGAAMDHVGFVRPTGADLPSKQQRSVQGTCSIPVRTTYSAKCKVVPRLHMTMAIASPHCHSSQ